MREADFPQFASLLEGVTGLYGKPASEVQIAVFFRALGGYPFREVQAGFDAHLRDPQRGRFAPMPADIIAQINGLAAEDGRPGPEEAWAVAMSASDEAVAVVWTDEIAEAWGTARHVLARGDEVGARMCFREAYGRLVDDARRARRPVKWWGSMGQGESERDERSADAVRLAADRGLLPAPEAPLLPAPAQPFEALERRAPLAVAEKLRALRQQLCERVNAPSTDALEKKRTAQAREAMRHRVESMRVPAAEGVAA